MDVGDVSERMKQISVQNRREDEDDETVKSKSDDSVGGGASNSETRDVRTFDTEKALDSASESGDGTLARRPRPPLLGDPPYAPLLGDPPYAPYCHDVGRWGNLPRFHPYQRAPVPQPLIPNNVQFTMSGPTHVIYCNTFYGGRGRGRGRGRSRGRGV